MSDTSSPGIRIEKFHGAGNSLLLVDSFTRCSQITLSSPTARVLCDPRLGIGADGVMELTRRERDGMLELMIWNADGTDGGLCGNGIRCACSLLASRGVNPTSISMQTRSGRTIRVRSLGGKYEVGLGTPEFSTASLGINTASLSALDLCGAIERYEIFSRESSFVGVGNPHVVICCGANDDPDAALDEIAKPLHRNDAFTNGVNIHTVRVQDRESVVVRTSERGVGRTPSCGTGVCAVLACGVQMGALDRRITAHCPGGQLTAEWVAETNELWLGGPVQYVASLRVNTQVLLDDCTNIGGSGTLSVSQFIEREHL